MFTNRKTFDSFLDFKYNIAFRYRSTFDCKM